MWLISLYYHKSFVWSIWFSCMAPKLQRPVGWNSLRFYPTLLLMSYHTLSLLYSRHYTWTGICSIHKVNFHVFILLGRSVRRNTCQCIQMPPATCHLLIYQKFRLWLDKGWEKRWNITWSVSHNALRGIEPPAGRALTDGNDPGYRYPINAYLRDCMKSTILCWDNCN